MAALISTVDNNKNWAIKGAEWLHADVAFSLQQAGELSSLFFLTDWLIALYFEQGSAYKGN